MICGQPVAREFEGAGEEIGPIRALGPPKGALAVSEKELEPLLTVKSRARMGLNMTVILKEQQQQKWAFEGELKAAEAAKTWKKSLSTV